VQDHTHCEVVLAFAAQGYHILCENPMAAGLRDCLDMEKTVKNTVSSSEWVTVSDSAYSSTNSNLTRGSFALLPLQQGPHRSGPFRTVV
jgi:hypothetical protein